MIRVHTDAEAHAQHAFFAGGEAGQWGEGVVRASTHPTARYLTIAERFNYRYARFDRCTCTSPKLEPKCQMPKRDQVHYKREKFQTR
jgi:hypothetical protein